MCQKFQKPWELLHQLTIQICVCSSNHNGLVTRTTLTGSRNKSYLKIVILFLLVVFYRKTKSHFVPEVVLELEVFIHCLKLHHWSDRWFRPEWWKCCMFDDVNQVENFLWSALFVKVHLCPLTDESSVRALGYTTCSWHNSKRRKKSLITWNGLWKWSDLRRTLPSFRCMAIVIPESVGIEFDPLGLFAIIAVNCERSGTVQGLANCWAE